MDPRRKYDLISSKKANDMTTYNELKRGDPLSMYKDQIANEAMWIEFQIRDIEITEGVHTCRKCGSKKVYTTAEQTRSADEGMTFFCLCSNPKCKNVWKL